MSLLNSKNRLSLAFFADLALVSTGWAAGDHAEVDGFVQLSAVIGLLAGAAALIPGFRARHTPREIGIAALIAGGAGIVAWRHWSGPYLGYAPSAGLLAAAALLRLVIALKDGADAEEDAL